MDKFNLKIVFIFMIFSSISCYSIEEKEYIFGLYFDSGLNLFNTDIKGLPGVPNCCPDFKTGWGVGYSGGMYIQLPLNFILNDLGFKIFAGANLLSGKFSEKEDELINLDGSPLNGEFEHKIDAVIQGMEYGFSLKYQLYEGLNYEIGTYISNILEANFSQLEEIIKPERTGVFWDSGKRTRNDTSGNIQGYRRFIPYIYTGISYDLPMNTNGSLRLIPELKISYPLKSFLNESGPNVSDEADFRSKWDIWTVRLGINIAFRTATKIYHEIYEEKYLIDTIRITNKSILEELFTIGYENWSFDSLYISDSLLITKTITRTDTLLTTESDKKLRIKAFYYLSGNLQELKKIDLEKKEIFNMVPLLNYIFFEKNSFDIEKKYKLLSNPETRDFTIESLYNLKSIDIYYQVLNIIGSRLHEFTNSKITLIGCNAGETENNDIKLSEKRAEVIKNYLVTTWGINPKRIEILSINLPVDPSNQLTNEGNQENQRVEITSDDNRIFFPIISNKIYYEPIPDKIYFVPEKEDSFNEENWELNLTTPSVNNKEEFIIFNNSESGKLPEQIEVKLDKSQFDPQKNDKSLKYFISINEVNDNKIISDTTSIYLNYINNSSFFKDKKTDTVIASTPVITGSDELYRLILFSYNNPEISTKNKEIINFIKERVSDYKKVIITGYTDISGDSIYNNQLSLQRAENAAKELNILDAEVRGLGEDNISFDNTRPEGRFYSRTVEIYIQK